MAVWLLRLAITIVAALAIHLICQASGLAQFAVSTAAGFSFAMGITAPAVRPA